ncbi:MAG: cyclic pyranopterin monophosphate synthase MoaC [Bacteroidales bacterium]|nr:cyclic pyranopterin monophosphate synthase MoaC [Bacteroidales bacterium]MDT8430743.1 cyclic pyranopterin monophosphate synthase MoaC [Bacteroidales bacterium]
MKKLSHIDNDGKARMVDVGDKPESHRIARATGFISLDRKTISLVRDGLVKKGDVITVAEIAGIQAAKQTAQLIPLCHNLLLTKVEVTCQVEDEGIRAESLVKCTGQTGVEMEALSAVSVALLTVYDMCKAVDKNMLIKEVRLVSKEKQEV